MRTKHLLLGAAVVVAVVVPFGVVQADDPPEIPRSPAKACDWLAIYEPEGYEFLATQPGGCESSVASVGIEALMEGAFPSNAAAVGNCKFLEQNFFIGNPDEGLPDYLDDGKPYPYQFYWFEGVTDPNLYARNRADCIRVLELLHGGYPE